MRISSRLALAAALTFATAWPASAQTPRDTVVIAKQIDDIISLDPAEAFEISSVEANANIYDMLMGFDPKDLSRPVGALASGWEISEDGRTYTFKLKRGLKFHSGNPVTSADVAWSLERVVLMNKSPGFILTQFGFTKDNVAERIKALDESTVAITLDKPYAPTFFLNCLTHPVMAIIDAKLVKSKAVDNDFGNGWLKTNSAGSGAYQLRAWRANEQYSLEANPAWYNGAPKTKRVVVRHVGEAASQRLLLEKGDVDYARNLSKDQLAAIAGNKDLAVSAGDKGYILYLGLNQKNAVLAKPEVREALKWLVDYDGIEKNIVTGTYRIHQTYLPRGYLGAINERPYQLDVARAKGLLAKAGVPNGFTVTMDVRNISPLTDIAQSLQATWAQAGVKLDLIVEDGRQQITRYRARQHDIFIGPWGPDYLDPHSNADTFAANPDNADDAKTKPVAWRNAWDIPEMSKQTMALALERDAGRRAAGYEASQREILKVSPYVLMFQQIDAVAHRRNVSGFVIGANSATNFYWPIVKN